MANFVSETDETSKFESFNPISFLKTQKSNFFPKFHDA